MVSRGHSKFINPTVNSSKTALLESITGKLTTTVFRKKDSGRCSSMIDAAHVFTISTTHRAVSAGDNGIYLFIPFFIIQLIHVRVQEARLLRHQLPNSLPITNKQQRRGSDVERPTVKVVAQAFSGGLLVGSEVVPKLWISPR